MSRTYKNHTHIAGRDKWIRIKNKQFVSGSRSKVKDMLNSISDEESADETDDNLKHYKSLKKSSSGYLRNTVNVELDIFKHYKEAQSNVANNVSVHYSYFSGSIDHQIAIWYVKKHSISLPTKPDMSDLSVDDKKTKEIQFEHERRQLLEEYYKKAILEISDEDLKKIIHADCAKKGGSDGHSKSTR